MFNLKLSKLWFAGLLLGAGAVQAAGPASVSEVPAAWYADQIVTPAAARDAATTGFPTAAHEHGSVGTHYADVQPLRTRPSIAGSTPPFPSSPSESGSVL